MIQDDFKDTELDSDRMAMSFKVQTKWHVITGAPCSGKSTLIKQLADNGFKTAPEAAREYFEREIALGRSIEDIRADMISCIHGIMEIMLKVEHELDPKQTICLDRGYPDTLAFRRQFGLDPNKYLQDCFRYRYASVFILDRFPCQQDSVRIEDDAAADYLDEWHYRDYAALGYDVIRVPVLPPQERLAFVLEKLSHRDL